MKRYINRHVPEEREETLQIDLTNFRSNAKGQKDFIHNLKIIDALYTDAFKESPALGDFADDDYYYRKVFSIRHE